MSVIWIMQLYSAFLCIVVHPKRFTIMWGGHAFSSNEGYWIKMLLQTIIKKNHLFNLKLDASFIFFK